MKWCYARSRISQKWLVPFHAESLSFPESTAIAVSVSSNIQDVFLCHSSSTFPPYLPLDRSTILTRIYTGYQVTGESRLVHSFSRRRDREREKEKKAESTSVRIRDRGISSSSKIGNQCGFTDGAFVRDRQLDKVRCDTPWVITLSYCAVLKCVGASRCWLGGCYCGCCCCCSCVFVLRYRPDYRLQSCSFFFFLFRSIHSTRLSSKRIETKV